MKRKNLIAKRKVKINKYQPKNPKIVNFYKTSFNIVNKNLKKIDTTEKQIYRQNPIDLNCSRHFKIFNKFKYNSVKQKKHN